MDATFPGDGLLRRLARDERGVAAIEYAILIALIAIAIVTALGGLGGGVADNWNEIHEAVDGAGTRYETPDPGSRQTP